MPIPADEPASIRSLHTGETYQQALQEIDAGPGRLPLPDAAGPQEQFEAEILAALIAEFGRHDPHTVGGPYALHHVTPRTDELLVRVDRTHLARFAAAVIPTIGPDGQVRGVAGLRWRIEGKDVILHRLAARIVLARTFGRDWRRAVLAYHHNTDGAPAAGPGGDRPWHRHEHATAVATAAAMAGCTPHLSATLRRIGLVRASAALPFRGGLVDLRITTDVNGRTVLTDHAAPKSTLTPLWITMAAPKAFWPRTPQPASEPTAAADAVITLVGQAGDTMAAAAALCAITAVPAEPAALAAATWALEIAEQQLRAPANRWLHGEGGWAANRRRYTEDFLYTTGPLDPPGTADLLAGHDIDLAAVGLLTCPQHPDPAEHHSATLAEGKQALLAMLDWALACATRPTTPRYHWQRATPTDARHGRPDGKIWTAPQPLPGAITALQLRITHADEAGAGFRYSIHPGPDAVPDWVHHAEPPLRFGTADSLPAAMLLAEHAAAECVAAAANPRTAERRLLQPRTITVDRQPTTAELLRDADPGHILDLHGLLAALSNYAPCELADAHDIPQLHAAAAGHWGDGAGFWPTPQTLTAIVGDDRSLPATRPGEDANTAPVDSAAYRRHLARHRAAIDPLAERYLAAADATATSATFAVRHHAGVRALRAADLNLIAAAHPTPAGTVTDLATLIAAIPDDVTELHRLRQTHQDL